MLVSIFKQNKFSFLFTLLLILLEAGLTLLFPLFIGYALDGAIGGSYDPVYLLGGLGVVTLLVGAIRRFFDSRFYARVYERLSVTVMSTLEQSRSSVKSARLGMIRELIEFFENALPDLINHVIGLVGVVVIIAALNIQVFYGSLAISLVVFSIYWLSSKTAVRYHAESNNEYEKQVDVLSKNDAPELRGHLKSLMKWNIRLSDLEVINFSLSWVVLMAFLVMAIILSVQNGIVQYGALTALIMYVFQFIESAMNLPLYYQNALRLKEILGRIEGD